MEVNLQGKDSVTVINAYAPTSSAEDEKVKQFYDDIEEQWLIVTQIKRSLNETEGIYWRHVRHVANVPQC